MPKNYIIIATCLIALFSGCKFQNTQNPPNYNNASVEDKAPNTNYKPAFEGQTRVKSVRTQTDLDIKLLSEELVNPWGIANFPDGRFLITEKAGTMRIVTTEGQLSKPIIGLPAVNPAGQGGLLGVTVDPQFDTNRMVYWSFSEKTSGGNVTAVGKGRLSDNETTIQNATVIYRAMPGVKSTLHYGSRILFDKSGNLIISTGEGSNLDTRPHAQYLNSALGKIIRITKNGEPSPDNPFIGNKNARPEIYSYGHRNVQSLAFHPESGDLWEAEFGPRGGDELNLIKPGKNYGWPIITYGIEYSGEKINNGLTQKEGMEQPVYYWDPVVSPSGMTFYSSDIIPEWKNNLFIGCLSGSHILRLVIENNKVIGEERLLEGLNQRFRSIIEGKDGALYAICDGVQGRLYRIGKK